MKTPPSVRKFLGGNVIPKTKRHSTDSESVATTSTSGHFQSNLSAALVAGLDEAAKLKTQTLLPTPEPVNVMDESTTFDSLVKNLSETLEKEARLTPTAGLLSTSNSADLLSISPIFGKPSYDTQSLDESSLATPDELTRQDFIRGIRNINYDIDFSDPSADNSVADDIEQIKSFNAILKNTESDGGGMSKSDLEEFDPLMAKDKAPSAFSLDLLNDQKLAAEDALTKSLIDDDSPNARLLESPLKPTVTDYRGFTAQGFNIPTISCNTGEFSSLTINDTHQNGNNTNSNTSFP